MSIGLRLILTSLVALVAAVFVPAVFPVPEPQPEWRFGYEWNENWPWSPRWPAASHDLLLSKLARAGGGAINVNGLAGWASLQAREGAPLNFETGDTVVRRFQNHGLELTWYLNSDARWAWANPNSTARLGASMAPAPDKEDDWKQLVRSIVERYDGDGVDDMPGLVVPVRFFILTGEVRFDKSGLGDDENPPFWADTIDQLLRLHRLTYEAVREADPRGFSKLVSSGAILWDLYADFPDYPAFDPADNLSAIQRRLRGENFKRHAYTSGWNELKRMLDSFGDDADGIECDYIGWHPHFSWRVIEQEFALIRNHAGTKPIYVDDMWSNLFPIGYAAIPGEAQFTASRTPNRAWVQAINGDFPNLLFTTQDPYGELFQKLNGGNRAVLDWYYANGARQLVKSFVTAFGEGAERASFSGTNDSPLFGSFRGWELGWLNLLGTLQEGYAEKPQYHTYRMLAEKLGDFTTATRIRASADPRTRLYRFERPRGPVYVLWSETGGPPPLLNYRVPTGETVSFKAQAGAWRITHPITRPGQNLPETESFITPSEIITMQLGHEPILLEQVNTP